MNSPSRPWLVPALLLTVLTLPGLSLRLCRADANNSAYDQKLAQSQSAAEHLDDRLALQSTIKIIIVVVLISIIAAIYFIRKDKTEDKDLEQ